MPTHHSERSDPDDDSDVVARLKSRLISVLGAGRAVATEGIAAGRAVVNDRLEERKRNDLLQELGAVYYRALSAGDRAVPDPDEVNPIVAALQALETGDTDTA